MVHPASVSDDALLAESRITFLRRGGPGGQHRNKTETAVIIQHTKTGVCGEANERRSQSQNRRLCIFRLRLALATHVRETDVEDQSISDLWRGRVSHQRISISAEHPDFPSLLAEALDRIVSHDYQLDRAAVSQLVTPSQLVKLLKQHRPAFDMVNRERQERGLGILR